MNYKLIAGLVLATLIIITASCKKEEQVVTPPPPENETITTVVLAATNTADATDVQTAKWIDLTPNDGNPDLSNATLNLRKNAVYNVNILFLDETKSPADSISNEVRERANYHLVCFGVASGLKLAVQRLDHDTNVPALELGLVNKFTTTDTSRGNLNVTLHHQPNQKNGDCDRGTTDVDVNFTIKIQ